MKIRAVVFAAILALATSVAPAQGRGGGGGGQQQGQKQTQQQAGGAAERGTTDRAQLRTRATDRQRDQYRTCTQAMDRVRTQTRTMASNVGGRQFDPGGFRQEMGRLREQLRTMNEERARLIAELDREQRAASRDWIRKMDQLRERAEARMHRLDQELAAEMPNRQRIAKEARALERDVNQWMNEHRAMGKDLGLSK
jgi:hypothetical protein